MRDFTLNIYKSLLKELIKANYKFTTFAEFIETKPRKGKLIILRHDVDKIPLRSMAIAEMENELGIKGTYYFRVARKGFPKGVIEGTAKLGHEIGYHYEDMDAAHGVESTALASFRKNLALLREITPVRTICMHGSPLSPYDNRDLWRNYDYRDMGILGEPYFDVDYSKVLFLTDTGRSWNGARASIRDRVERRDGMHQRIEFRSTLDIIRAIRLERFPAAVIITVHPQRWTDNLICWSHEFVWQKVKNIVKIAKVNKSFKRDASGHGE